MTRCECIQCGYDLTPLVRSVREAATCPECGHVGLPAPINFMGLLRSRQRTVFYMILPMLIAAPIVLLLRLAGFHLYGMPMLIAVPAAVLVPTIVCTTREGRARGRPIWKESLLLMGAGWAASAMIFAVAMWLARVM